jgi:hypothetical protein
MSRWWLSAAAIAALQGCAAELPGADKSAAAPAPLPIVADPPPEPVVEAPKKEPPKKVARPRAKPTTQLANVQPQAGTTNGVPTNSTTGPVEAKASEPQPVNLVGLDEQQLTALLGTPTEQEQPTPAKVWRYRKATCTLDITLFPDVQTRTYRSLAYEVTSNDNTAEGKRACVSQRHVDAGTQ